MAAGEEAGPELRLRLMATSDLHMQLTSYDYFRGAPAAAPGSLGQLAGTIQRLRAEAQGNALLFDNGDLLQGNPLADHLAEQGWDGIHPAVAFLHALGCDAATLGNHDLTYGPAVLRRVLRETRHPVVLANAALPGALRLPSFALLRRQLHDADGRAHPLAIGVVGLIPPQTAIWEARAMPGLATGPLLPAARAAVAGLNAAGADLIVLLAHSGLGDATDDSDAAENAAAALARLPGVGAVFAGHSHLPFPAAREAGLIGAIPVALPGARGAHLAVIDLVLAPAADPARWRIAAATAGLHPATGLPVPAQLQRLVLPAHRRLMQGERRSVARSSVRLTSHFGALGQDAGLALVAAACRWAARRVLARPVRAAARLPLLVSVAAFRSGGRGGPANFTDIPAGTLKPRHVADLYCFPNHLDLVEIGAEGLLDWLERAASTYATLQPGRCDQPLLDPRIPGYEREVVFGARCQIDLSAPPRYGPDGAPTGAPGRVRGLSVQGRAVAPGERFVLATNSHRRSATGLMRLPEHRLLWEDGRRVRDILRQYLGRRRRVAPHAQLPFALAPLAPGTGAWLDTAPDADLASAGRPTRALGLTGHGFLRVQVALDAAPDGG